MSSIYNIYFTEQAAEVRDSLPGDRQVVLRRALLTLADDPRPKASAMIKGDDNTRSVALTRTMAVDYTISDGMLFIILIHIVDTDHVLTEES